MQVGGAPAEDAELWKEPEIVESALNCTALTFRKTFNSNSKRDVLNYWKKLMIALRPITEEQIRTNVEFFKWYLSIHMNFCKSTSPGSKTDPSIMFHPGVFKSIDIH